MLLLRLVLAGIVGGAIGVLVGGYFGNIAAVICDSSGEWGCLESAVWGAFIGESVFMPLGVHLASPRRWNFLLLLLRLVGVGAISVPSAVVALATIRFDEILLATPVIQLGVCIGIEWSAARSSRLKPDNSPGHSLLQGIRS